MTFVSNTSVVFICVVATCFGGILGLYRQDENALVLKMEAAVSFETLKTSYLSLRYQKTEDLENIEFECSVNSGYVELGTIVMSQRLLSSVSFCYETVNH